MRGPFPSKEIRRISKRDDPCPPVVPGGLVAAESERAEVLDAIEANRT
jgi:hypothetical protein